MAEHNTIGIIGEKIAKTFLMKQGFIFIEQNYRTRYGEIDIIFQKDTSLRFIEVKSIKVRDLENLKNLAITPEDNLTQQKWSKLKVTVTSYLRHRAISHETKYQIDLACVYVDTEKRQGRVKLIENISKD